MLMVESAVDLVTKLCNEVDNFKQDDVALKEQMKDLSRLFDGPPGPPSLYKAKKHSDAGSSTSQLLVSGPSLQETPAS
jgi:hypothetical protein